MRDHSLEFRQGARAALAAMRELNELIKDRGFGISDDEYYAAHERGIALFLEAAGPLTEHARGLVAACAEYLIFCEDCGLPDIDVWKPESTMTASEIERDRARIDLYGLPEAACNVIPLRP